MVVCAHISHCVEASNTHSSIYFLLYQASFKVFLALCFCSLTDVLFCVFKTVHQTQRNKTCIISDTLSSATGFKPQSVAHWTVLYSALTHQVAEQLLATIVCLTIRRCLTSCYELITTIRLGGMTQAQSGNKIQRNLGLHFHCVTLPNNINAWYASQRVKMSRSCIHLQRHQQDWKTCQHTIISSNAWIFPVNLHFCILHSDHTLCHSLKVCNVVIRFSLHCQKTYSNIFADTLKCSIIRDQHFLYWLVSSIPNEL